MHRICKTLARGAGRRSGMTLTEVLLGLAVFLTGSVSIVSLFVTAGVLHAEASNRRTAAFIAEELIAEAQDVRFSEVFAKTDLNQPTASAGDGSFDVQTTQAEMDYPSANFDLYPIRHNFFPLQAEQEDTRTEGPFLIGSDLIYYSRRLANRFATCDHVAGPGGSYVQGDPILQPRTWFYVLDADIDHDDDTVLVNGNPQGLPDGSDAGAPVPGYIVVDEEWMRYDARSATSFTISDANNDGKFDRGVGGTAAVAHKAGTPVTVAREHPFYPGFYYTVQFYPTNARGTSARMIVSVAYATGNMFRAWTFQGAYTPRSR
ncbi:MAG: hypothetical protein GXY85_10960 [Candidatus Brocadiaceae bacterium]|nr:hypothetical protein [Candidatus Brocadiaceae bacterium]